MNKCKCEYYSKVTGEKITAMMVDRFDFINIIDENNIDFDKEVKIFEKDGEWKLAQHIIKGETIYKKYSQNKDKKVDIQSNNDNIFETIFNNFFNSQDTSKPELQLIKTEYKNKD